MAAKKSKKKSVKKTVAKKSVKKSAKKATKKAVKKTAKKKSAKKSADKTFIVTYHMSPAAVKKAAAIRAKDPNAVMEGYKKWNAWALEMGPRLVDFGAPLTNGIKLDSKGASPSKRQLSGYSILNAKSLVEAKRLLKKHPHLSWTPSGCEIEVHETIPM